MHNLNIKITSSAEADMQNIFDFIAKDNISKAKELIDVFEEKFKILAMFPNSGFRKSYLTKRDIREYIVAKHYQIIYYKKENTLYIQRILTGYQDFFIGY